MVRLAHKASLTEARTDMVCGLSALVKKVIRVGAMR